MTTQAQSTPMPIQQDTVPILALSQGQQEVNPQIGDNEPPHPGSSLVPLRTQVAKGQAGLFAAEIGHSGPGAQPQLNDGIQMVPVPQPTDGARPRLTREDKGKAVIDESSSYIP